MSKKLSNIEVINKGFQSELLKHGFPLYQEKVSNGILYRGKILFEHSTVPVLISITDENGQFIVQIVFHDLITTATKKTKYEWLEFINHWNDSNAASYYLCLSQRERLYFRTVFVVEDSMIDKIYTMFLMGCSSVEKLLQELNK